MVIRTNIMALRVLGESRKTGKNMSKTLEKLSSGLRINRAADDAAGLGVSESMRSQITEMIRCQRNVSEGIDVTNTADGALTEINDMLRRASELCVQAENGVYDANDRQSISDEMNELFDEIDHITASTRHNNLQLFRYTGGSISTKFEYAETFTPTGPGDPLAQWGAMDFVRDAEFDEPKAANSASVTMKFDDSVRLNDAMTLNGKSLTIRGATFYFSDGTITSPSGGRRINISPGQTVQDAMNSLKSSYGANYYPPLKSIEVNDNGTVTFKAGLQNLSETITVDGATGTNVVTDGDGAYANTYVIGCTEGTPLFEVDGSGAANNKPVYSSTATASLTLSDSPLTAGDITNLNGNKLNVCGQVVSLAGVFSVGMTRDQVGAALVGKINGLANLNAAYADGKLTVTRSGLPTTAPSNLTIFETKTNDTSSIKNGTVQKADALSLTPTKTGNATTDGAASIDGAALGITNTIVKPASMEGGQVSKITIPPVPSGPFSFQTSDGKKFLFYDASDPSFDLANYPQLKYNESGVTPVNISGMSADAVAARVAAEVTNGIKRKFSGAVVEQAGNELTVRFSQINTPQNLSGTKGIAIKATPYKTNPETWEITLPAITQPLTKPFSFQTSSYKRYYFYDSSKTDFKTADYGQMSYDQSYVTKIDTKNMTADQINDKIASLIAADNGATMSRTGNKVTIKANSPGTSLSLDTRVRGIAITATSYKTETTPGTQYVLGARGLGTQTSPKRLTQTVSVPLHLGAALDVNKLAGSGFNINGNKFEFTKGTGVRTDYKDVNIGAATTFEDVRQALETAMGSNYTVTLDTTDPADTQLKITAKKASDGYGYSFADGYHDTDGLFTNPGDASATGQFSGGTNIGHSQKGIDFSSITDDNLDTLLGKGFRITCATCSGEYINVFFCWENDGQMPPSFDVVDDVTGATRTIHNIAVELSKVSSGDQIVRDIVNQVRPSLKHFTDVGVGDTSTELIAMDKRLGNVTDGVRIYRGMVLSGLDTNFTYTVEKREIPDTASVGGNGGLSAEYRKLYIYAGSEPKHQWIPIHLPYLTLEVMNLSGGVDLNEQPPSQWLDRVKTANDLITTCRGRLGADHNRLEHCKNALTATEENVTAAESRIRDTDMAKVMAEQIKESILSQAQQAMLAQANTQPQRVLELLK